MGPWFARELAQKSLALGRVAILSEESLSYEEDRSPDRSLCMDDAIAVVLTLIARGNELTDDDLEWIDRQLILPAAPPAWEGDLSIGCNDATRLIFPSGQLHRIGAIAGAALVRELGLEILALTVQPWYFHLLYRPANKKVAVVRATTEVALQRLFGPDRSIWAEDYAKRYCFDPEQVESWIQYVEGHNLAASLAAKPWPFISSVSLQKGEGHFSSE